jgi:porin
MNRAIAFVLLATICSLSLSALAEQPTRTDSRPDFGGPDAVENLIADDDKLTPAMISKRLYQPWFDWKAGFAKQTGISFGIDYSVLYLTSNNDAGNANASGGMVRFYGSWDLIGRGTKNTGALVWKGEHRHRYSDVSPNEATLGPYGYVGFIGAPFSNQQERRNRLAPTALEASGGAPSSGGQRQRESGQVAASLAHDIGEIGPR